MQLDDLAAAGIVLLAAVFLVRRWLRRFRRPSGPAGTRVELELPSSR